MAPLSNAAVVEALRTVIDPQQGRDIVSLQLVKGLQVSEGAVALLMAPIVEPAVKANIEKGIRAALAKVGISSVQFHVEEPGGPTAVAHHEHPPHVGHAHAAGPGVAGGGPGGPGPGPGPGKRLSDKQPITGVKNLIAVASGKGGVGKTTVAVNLAIALARSGAAVGLMDADVYGPNVPVMLGATEQPRAVDEKTIIPVEAYGIKTISMGLLNPGDKPLIWRGPMLHSVMQQFLRNVQWGELDYLVVDLPPGTGDVQLSLIQSTAVTGAVLVTTPSIVALADVRKAIEMFRQVNVEILGVVENMSYFNCPHCNGRIDVFGHGEGERMAKAFGVPFLGAVEIDPQIRIGGDTGKPVVSLGEDAPGAASLFAVARNVARQVAAVNAGAVAPVVQIL
jgi:ATP-binding protein involved in chromosome partitioning